MSATMAAPNNSIEFFQSGFSPAFYNGGMKQVFSVDQLVRSNSDVARIIADSALFKTTDVISFVFDFAKCSWLNEATITGEFINTDKTTNPFNVCKPSLAVFKFDKLYPVFHEVNPPHVLEVAATIPVHTGVLQVEELMAVISIVVSTQLQNFNWVESIASIHVVILLPRKSAFLRQVIESTDVILRYLKTDQVADAISCLVNEISVCEASR